MTSFENIGKGAQSLSVEFTNTKPNEKIQPSSGIFIDFHGTVHGSSSGQTKRIVIQGGDNKGVYSKTPEEASPFFMTDSQRRALMRILKGAASSSDKLTITSSNGSLQEMAIAIYRNYCG